MLEILVYFIYFLLCYNSYMSIESDMSLNENNAESFAEIRKKLAEGFGIAVCTTQKSGHTTSLIEQIGFIEKLCPACVQFDFRNRTAEEIREAVPLFETFRKNNPDMALSLHGESPKINEDDAGMKNQERITYELSLATLLSAESFTVHPPSINFKLYSELDGKTQDTIIDSYASVFAEYLEKVNGSEKVFCVAIENMPGKGDGGAYGQTPDELNTLISRIKTLLLNKGILPERIEESLGVTLDINHALHDIENDHYEEVLEHWFGTLGQKIRVIHLYTPSKYDSVYAGKYELVLNLAARYSSRARILMESKQSFEVTKNVYEAGIFRD